MRSSRTSVCNRDVFGPCKGNTDEDRPRFSAAAAGLALTLALLAVLPAAHALQQRQDKSRFDSIAIPDPSLVVSPETLTPAAAQVPEPVRAGWKAFKAANGEAWDMYLDARSGAPLLVQGQGIPLIPGSGNTLQSASAAPDT